MRGPGRADQLVGLGRHLAARTGSNGETILFSESAVTRLTGECVATAVTLLDGSRSLADIVRDRPEQVAAERMTSMVNALVDAGLAVTRDDVPAQETSTEWDPEAYWDAAGLRRSRMLGRTVEVVDVGSAGTAQVVSALAESGLVVSDASAKADADSDPALVVVLCADYLDPAIATIARDLRAAGRSWLPARPVGSRIWIGPFFDATGPGCWRCLTERMWRHRQAERLAGMACGSVAPAPRPAAATSGTTAVGAHLVAHEVAKYLAGHRHEGQRAVWVLDTLTLHGEHHAAPVDPHCSGCGTPPDPAAAPAEPRLVLRPVADGPEGDYRIMPAEDLLETLQHLVSPVTGVVKRLRRVADEASNGHAFRAGPSLGATSRDLDQLAIAMRRESGGKGRSAAGARAAALCEALERYSGDFRGGESRVRGSLRSLGARAVDPRDCMLYSDDQYAGREEWNARHPPSYGVPEPFDPDAELDWSPLWSISARRWRLLPTAMLYYGVPCAAAPSLRADSNGCAAGACMEEAVLYGLLEVLERDAVAQWWYGRRSVPACRLDRPDPWIDRVVDLHARQGREVWTLDVTRDSDVPVVVAVSRRTAGPEDIVFGFGAHLDPAGAARRALAEVNQMLHMVEPGAAGGYVNTDPVATAWWRTATVATHPFLAPAGAGWRREALTSGDLLRDIEMLSGRVAAAGHEVLVLDQTRADVGLPVVKVVVPGMRPLTPSFAPGRLTLGPDGPNPIPLFL
jgi:ribosomal protein S12 methylthiotransferase accessory factor